MRKVTYLAMALSMSLLACSQEAEQDVVRQNKAVAARKASQSAAELHSKGLQKVLDNRYSFDKIDNKGLEQKLKKARSREEVIAAFTESGMTNAEEYVASIEERMDLFAKTFKENPEWGDNEKKSFIKKSMEEGSKEVKENVNDKLRAKMREKEKFNKGS